MYQEISGCRICGNRQLEIVLDLGTQALTGVFPKTRNQVITTGPLRLVKCTGDEDACGLLQLQHSYDLGELYGDNYGYRSGLNAGMVEHLRGKVRRILDQIPLPKDAMIIDIGANDSTTLQAYPKEGLRLVGVDPTGAKFKEFYPNHIQLIADFFSAETVRKHVGAHKAFVITSFSMLYDLDRPLRFVEEIRDLLDDDGIWVFEQSYMPTMLRRNSYDTVCHEHLEYYALRQIKWMVEKVGMKVVDVEFNDVNGGSFSVTAAMKDSYYPESTRVRDILDSEERDGLATLAPYHNFSCRVAKSRVALREFLEKSKKCGNSIKGIGASTKGNVLLQYCNITASEVAQIGEVNGDKFGSFTPGTLLPIVPEKEVLASNADYLLVLPWHFRSFFQKDKKLSGQNLVFPLPHLEVVHC
jgi:NDP-4-keto-2,6-dideoxyhexose 3-C-methyltransferase